MAEASSAASLGLLFSSLEMSVKTAIQHLGATLDIWEGTSSWLSLKKLSLLCLPISSDQGPSPVSGPSGPILGPRLPLSYSPITLSGSGVVHVSGVVSECHRIPSPGHLKLVVNSQQFLCMAPSASGVGPVELLSLNNPDNPQWAQPSCA